jgi:hypothetical protein
MRAISLDMEVRHSLGTWTLAESVARLKKEGMIRLLDREEADELAFTFRRAVEQGDVPTVGQTLAAYCEAATTAVWDEYEAEGSPMTERQRGARLAAISRVVFRRARA